MIGSGARSRGVRKVEMSDEQDQPRPHVKRRYLIDWRLQLSLVLPLLGVLGIVGLAYAAAIYVLPGEAALTAMTAKETRTLFFYANSIYYAIAIAALLSVALFLSHRVAGPAQVIERAVRGLRRGNYEERTSLRPSDRLVTLAEAVAELREHLREQNSRRRHLLQQVAARLDADEIAEARELLRQLELPEDRDVSARA